MKKDPFHGKAIGALLLCVLLVAGSFWMYGYAAENPLHSDSQETKLSYTLLTIHHQLRQQQVRQKIEISRPYRQHFFLYDQVQSQAIHPFYKREANDYTQIYLSDAEQAKAWLDQKNIAYPKEFKPDPNYRLPADLTNPQVLGQIFLHPARAPYVVLYVKDQRLQQYWHIDSRLIDLSPLLGQSFQIDANTQEKDMWQVVLDPQQKLQIDKIKPSYEEEK